MKFFLDTANLQEIRQGAAWGIVDGVTTNPSLIAKEGRPFEKHIREICDIVNGDISAEVVSTTSAEMIRDKGLAQSLGDWSTAFQEAPVAG